MERILEDYRGRKRKEKKFNEAKMKLKRLFFRDEPKVEDNKILVEEENLLTNETMQNDRNSDVVVLEDEDDNCNCCTYIDVIRYVLYFTLWASLYAIFINLQFGIVYLITSALVVMYLNTRTKPKKAGEVSAYSVFNKNCQSIDGTLKAEQFERELLFR